MSRYRHSALLIARGETLEIGFGTGLNLPHYPETVSQIIGVDTENMMQPCILKRISASAIPVNRMQIDAGRGLPFDEGSFDTIVTTMTLCTIADIESALAEIRRVMRPDGQFLFLEHGRSADRSVARLQDLFNPIQRIIAAGCNLNRPIDRMIKAAGFEIKSLDRFRMPKVPRIMAEMYRGVATCPDALITNY